MHNWKPERFDRYKTLFPETPAIHIDDHLDKSELFRSRWVVGTKGTAQTIKHLTHNTSIVFVRGYLGNYMPGNLIKPVKTLSRLGFDCFILKNKAGVNVKRNVSLLIKQLAKRDTKEQLIFCGHSKGGMECLSLLAQHKAIASRCAGVALSQTPSGPSPVLESVLQKEHRLQNYSRYRYLSESVQRLMLFCLRAQSGGYDLTSDNWPLLVDSVSNRKWPFPVLQTASWSIKPTAWLDSFHGRLSEISPDRAHDGQFYLDDLIWPKFSHILLPEVDHAQPAIGGSGFDSSRYWVVVLSVLADMIENHSKAHIEKFDNNSQQKSSNYS